MSEDMLGQISLSELRGLRDQVEDRLVGKNSARWVEELKKWLRKEPCWMELDFFDFFHTRSGLWISSDFDRLVSGNGTGTVRGMNHFDLPHRMSDAGIEKKLKEDFGKPHTWDDDDLLATLQKHIEAQWDGKSGVLLNNGFFNLFYTSSCVVDVYWFGIYRMWCVRTRQRDDYNWNADCRAFFPANRNSELRN